MQSRLHAQKCRDALIVLADCARSDPAAYQVLVNLTSTDSEILESVRIFSAARTLERNREDRSPNALPQLIPSFV
jgi:hypothetical protein